MSRTVVSRLFDTHYHLDLSRDPVAIVRECEARGIYTIAVTNAPSVFAATQSLVAGCKCVRAAIGMHPELVLSHGVDLEQFWLALERTRYVGEIGLDYVTSDPDNRARQRAVLTQILDHCARATGKVLTLHSRRAAADVIDAVGPTFPGHAILHWFSGSLRELRRAIDYGFYFSINPRMLSSASSSRILQAIPRDRILLETDGPFVTVNSRPAEPRDTILVVEQLAERWKLASDEVGAFLFENFRRLLEVA